MTNQEICYKCGAPATSREHVPPLCLFPERKDTGLLNFRKDLITVPSCAEHNLKKTKDDEFLLIAIAGIVGNNLLGYFHSQTKVSRALRRKSADFLEKVVVRNAKLNIIESKGGKKYPILQGNPDFKRLYQCFEQIALGLYFYKYKQVFLGEVRLMLGFIKYGKDDDNTMIDMIRERFKREELAEPEKGDNPQVFKYTFCAPDSFGLIALKMVFYTGTEVYASFMPTTADAPFDLTMMLIKEGIPTVVSIGEKSFTFNQGK